MTNVISALILLIGFNAMTFPQDDIKNIDPNNILFSIPTLSNEFPKMVAGKLQPDDKDVVLHEDDWAQVEFLPKSQLETARKMLREFKEFELINRTKNGWRKVYIRNFERSPVIDGDNALIETEKMLGGKAGSPPIISSVGGSGIGIVNNGFTLSLGRNINLYGYTSDRGIIVMGADIGENPDSTSLTNAFTKINARNGSILVDWKAQMILVSTLPSGQIEVWRP